MKKFLAIIIALAMVCALCACGNNGQEKSSKYVIGICQLTQHPALDKATEGFIDAVKESLGDDAEILNKNASGDISSCTTIVNEFVAQNVDLIMANATPALQAAAAATGEIPILGTSITHYAPALDIPESEWNGTVGGNISGTSDLADLKEQAKMITDWFPDTKTVGLLYCSAEANSVFQVKEVAKHLAEMGIESKEFSFTDTNDVASVANSACDYADVIYIPTDNVAAANTEAISNVVISRGVPVIAGEKDTCAGCGIATLSIDYYDLGYTTGKMAVRILKDGADISAMPIEYAPNATKYYNEKNCEYFDLGILAHYTAIE